MDVLYLFIGGQNECRLPQLSPTNRLNRPY